MIHRDELMVHHIRARFVHCARLHPKLTFTFHTKRLDRIPLSAFLFVLRNRQFKVGLSFCQPAEL
jgi:hypothetical protein